AIDFPNLFVERWHHLLVLVEDFIREFSQLIQQCFAIEFMQRLAPMPLKKATQNVMQQLARVDRLQIERRLAAWLKFQHSLSEKPISTIAVKTEAAGAVQE